jgi:hypothetical protein
MIKFLKRIFRKKQEVMTFEQFKETDKGLRYLTSDGDFIYFERPKNTNKGD